MSSALNIVAFNVPYPADHGGVIDVFYKVKYFHKKGIEVHLHCFEYGRGEQEELNKYCATVTYYKRKTGLRSILSKTPYIVKSRVSDALKQQLLKNDYPILFEGLHSCYLLKDRAFKDRFTIYRESNIEHDYYRHLAKADKNVFKRLYFNWEAKKLERFESVVENATISFVVSLTDLAYFQQKYPNNQFVFVPSFHAGEEVTVKNGTGDYVLYHGNLSVAENCEAAEFIVLSLFNTITTPLKIAGLNPPPTLIKLVEPYPHISLIPNPDEEEMDELIANAQINLLYTNQATGLKLKLLNVLYSGRYCIVNSKMVEGTSLGDACLVEDEIEKLKTLITDNFQNAVTDEQISNRKCVLVKTYSNENSFQKIMDVLSIERKGD